MRLADLDDPNVTVTTFDASADAITIELAVVDPDPAAWLQFRIVDVEPRLWWQTGIDGATVDVRSSFAVVRCPRVSGRIELVAGSY